MTDDGTLKAAHAEIRRERVLPWKQDYLKDHDVMVAPEPTDWRSELAGADGFGNVGTRLHHDDP